MWLWIIIPLTLYNYAGATVRARASIRWDYVSSAACRLPLGQRTDGLGPGRVQAGEALLVRVLNPNHAYDCLELASGDTVGLRSGDQFRRRRRKPTGTPRLRRGAPQRVCGRATGLRFLAWVASSGASPEACWISASRLRWRSSTASGKTGSRFA